MTEQTFVLRFRINGYDHDDEAAFTALDEGDADVLLHSIDGDTFVEVLIDAVSISRAVEHALKLLAARAPHVRVCSLERELTAATEIAERLDRSREQVRLWATGKRKPEGFPSPALWVGSTRVWDWADVQAWAKEHGIACDDDARYPDADTVWIVNAVLAESRRDGSLQPAMLVRHRLEAGAMSRAPDRPAASPHQGFSQRISGSQSLLPPRRDDPARGFRLLWIRESGPGAPSAAPVTSA